MRQWPDSTCCHTIPVVGNKINYDLKIEICFWKDFGKRRKCWFPAFSPSPLKFSKASFRVVKSRDCVVRSLKIVAEKENASGLKKKTFCYFHQIRNCRLHTVSVWKSLKFVVWEKVKGLDIILCMFYSQVCKHYSRQKKKNGFVQIQSVFTQQFLLWLRCWNFSLKGL